MTTIITLNSFIPANFRLPASLSKNKKSLVITGIALLCIAALVYYRKTFGITSSSKLSSNLISHQSQHNASNASNVESKLTPFQQKITDFDAEDSLMKLFAEKDWTDIEQHQNIGEHFNRYFALKKLFFPDFEDLWNESYQKGKSHCDNSNFHPFNKVIFHTAFAVCYLMKKEKEQRGQKMDFDRRIGESSPVGIAHLFAQMLPNRNFKENCKDSYGIPNPLHPEGALQIQEWLRTIPSKA
jgi:hypothetical protein